MQTRLRVVSLMFVAGLLWMSPTLEAKRGPRNTTKKPAPINHSTGVASWYGIHHQGRKMANGKRFDRNKLTAACWFLPLGTVVQVVNLKNGNTVDVTVADRGPNNRLRRLIDLSEAAATKLDFLADGLTSVFLSPVASVTAETADLSGQVIEPLLDVPPRNETALNLLPDGRSRP